MSIVLETVSELESTHLEMKPTHQVMEVETIGDGWGAIKTPVSWSAGSLDFANHVLRVMQRKEPERCFEVVPWDGHLPWQI